MTKAKKSTVKTSTKRPQLAFDDAVHFWCARHDQRAPEEWLCLY